MDYDGEIVHLSLSDDTLLEIPEGKLSPEDLTYVRSLYAYETGKGKGSSVSQHRVIARLCCLLLFAQVVRGRETTSEQFSPSYALISRSLLRPPPTWLNWNHGRLTSSLSFESVGLGSRAVQKESVGLGSRVVRKERTHRSLQIGSVWCATL